MCNKLMVISIFILFCSLIEICANPLKTLEKNFSPTNSNSFIIDSKQRNKRYVLSKEKWHKETLTWKLHKKQLSNADMYIIRVTLHRAFELWSSVSSLKFVEIILNNELNEPVDINILFLKGKHGDGLPFDGPRIVAHAFYPSVGALHFDAEENWTLNQSKGINFFQTAVHEIGHILGLEHSTDFRAVMYPRNRKFESDYQLSDDDVRAIRRLYPANKK